jgi:hypothetical protein
MHNRAQPILAKVPHDLQRQGSGRCWPRAVIRSPVGVKMIDRQKKTLGHYLFVIRPHPALAAASMNHCDEIRRSGNTHFSRHGREGISYP